MTKIVIVMAIVASLCFVEAIPPGDNPLKFVSDVVGFDVKEMVDTAVSEASQAVIRSSESGGSSVGSIVTSNKEIIIENGVPVEKVVTRYTINKDGTVYQGIL